MDTKILRENAKAGAVQELPGISNSLNWSADRIEHLETALKAIIAQETEYANATVTRMADIARENL
ncbi:MAG: hypothetical protein KAI73_09135 [Rhodospirillaceae bacterium]|nr:hypothetical protein [Rhodospirillaceae bacterium]